MKINFYQLRELEPGQLRSAIEFQNIIDQAQVLKEQPVCFIMNYQDYGHLMSLLRFTVEGQFGISAIIRDVKLPALITVKEE